jgi:NAD/NADP transhydrogenase beta subunit
VIAVAQKRGKFMRGVKIVGSAMLISFLILVLSSLALGVFQGQQQTDSTLSLAGMGIFQATTDGGGGFTVTFGIGLILIPLLLGIAVGLLLFIAWMRRRMTEMARG